MDLIISVPEFTYWLCSDCTDASAELNLHLAHMSKCTFLTLQIRCWLIKKDMYDRHKANSNDTGPLVRIVMRSNKEYPTTRITTKPTFEDWWLLFWGLWCFQQLLNHIGYSFFMMVWWGRGSLCGPNICSLSGAASELKVWFRAGKTG